MMGYNPSNPLIVQGDMTVLLETMSPLYVEGRDLLARFAELESSPEFVHTYRITALGLWNAVASGLTVEEITSALLKFAKYPVPEAVIIKVRDWAGRYGRLRLIKENGVMQMVAADVETMEQVTKVKSVRTYLGERIAATRCLIEEKNRGLLKHALIKINFPVEDLAGYTEGAPLEVELRDVRLAGKPFDLRTYQRDAADVFYAGGGTRGGSGVLVLPCGAGKTVIGIASMSRVKQKTLILTTNITALRQWRNEIIDKTSLAPDMVGEYSGEVKNIKPVTVTTYQLLTFRKKKTDVFVHMEVFNAENWGLIIYDEVHMLPAPIFREVANLQARRRLGLTATLVREDGLQDEVFSLIGPKKFDMPWKNLENAGWIARAECIEIRVPLPQAMRMDFARNGDDLRIQFRLASENPHKLTVIHRLIAKHQQDNILIIGQYIDQLELLSREFNAPIITGKTPNKERDTIFAAFKKKEYKILIVSKVANFAIDLPDANVAIQVSGTFGSRQEEAQRLGRVLRPKGEGLENIAHFYSVTTKETNEQEFAEKRQRFLAEQGYNYRIVTEKFDDADEKKASERWELMKNRLLSLPDEEDDLPPIALPNGAATAKPRAAKKT
jgi:DNA excision repair protein ERCC-3